MSNNNGGNPDVACRDAEEMARGLINELRARGDMIDDAIVSLVRDRLPEPQRGLIGVERLMEEELTVARNSSDKQPDVNETLRSSGVDGVRKRSDNGVLYTNGGDTLSLFETLMGAKPEPPPPLRFINISNWDNEPVPEQQWTVFNRIPRGHTVLFSGQGGAGKSTLNLQQAAAHALNREWLNTMPEPGHALFIDAEDDEKVIHRRLAAIASHYKVSFRDLEKGGLYLMSLFGRDAVLATPTRSGKIQPTSLFKQLLEAAGDIKPVMTSIAASANVFAGNENDRSQVQQFITLLTQMAIRANGSVSLISHPSLSGISRDSGESGTTQWHNSVRARSYMKTMKPEDGEPLDTDLRELVFKKNNYGPISETISLQYQNGLFLPVQGIGTLDRLAQEQQGEFIFLELLRRFTAQNRKVSDKTGTSYAPALFAKEDEAKKARLNSKALTGAMRRLFAQEKIWNEPCGKPSRPSYHIAKR